MGFIDLIFPKKCVICRKQGSYLCEKCFTYLSFDTKALCLVCNKPAFNNLTHAKCKRKLTIDGCISALPYNKPVRKLIFNFKCKPYLTDLKTVLVELFYESIIQNEQFIRLIENNKWTMVPIPLSSSKLRKRGYNQVEILTKGLSKKLNIPAQNLLTRVKENNNQGKVNITDEFQVGGGIIKDRNIFLVDDVVSTGSTLLEAAGVLKKAGAGRVIGLTLARS